MFLEELGINPDTYRLRIADLRLPSSTNSYDLLKLGAVHKLRNEIFTVFKTYQNITFSRLLTVKENFTYMG